MDIPRAASPLSQPPQATLQSEAAAEPAAGTDAAGLTEQSGRAAAEGVDDGAAGVSGVAAAPAEDEDGAATGVEAAEKPPADDPTVCPGRRTAVTVDVHLQPSVQVGWNDPTRPHTPTPIRAPLPQQARNGLFLLQCHVIPSRENVLQHANPRWILCELSPATEDGLFSTVFCEDPQGLQCYIPAHASGGHLYLLRDM